MKIAVVVCSRGMVHSRTMADIFKVLDGYDWELVMTHGLPIPDCLNEGVAQALRLYPDYILTIEDDMQLPLGIVQSLIDANVDIAISDYPVREYMHCVIQNKDRIACAGFGCTLIRREVFDVLDEPYFSDEREYKLDKRTLELEPRPTTFTKEQRYGLHDVDFYYRTQALGLTHKVITAYQAGQYFLESPKLPKDGNLTGLEYKVATWRL